MAKKPNERNLTVSYCREDYYDADISFIWLKRKWQRDSGFEVSIYAKVNVVRDMFVITKDSDRDKREKQKKLEKLKTMFIHYNRI